MAAAPGLEAGNTSMDTIHELVTKVSLYEIDTPTFHDDPQGDLSILDLPVYDMGDQGVAKSFLDIVMDVEGPIPKGNLKQSFMSKSPVAEIQPPFGLKKDPQQHVKLDIAVVPQNDGKFLVCKLINLKDKVKTPFAKSLCYGSPRLIDWLGNVRAVKKCVHFIFEHLGGFQIRNHVLRSHEDGKPEKERSAEEWEFGFDFIEQSGPRDNVKNKMLRWVTVQVNNPDSPVYKWPPVLVEKSLRNLSNDGVLAQVHDQWPLTLFDLDIRFLNALAPLVQSLKEKAIGFHGEPGAGKTPVARTIAMAISRHWIRKAQKIGEVMPSFRQASEFDFFRGQAGSIFRPDIFDDGSFCEQQFKKIKAFTDVGNIEAMSKERWGAAKWVKGQLRMYCVNDFDAQREPKDDMPILQKRAGQHGFVSHKDFMAMLDNAWFSREANDSNIMAVLKRTHLFVNTNTFLYVRPAGEEKRPVMRIPLHDKTDLLHEHSRVVYDFYRKGGADLPSNFEEKVRFEEKWMAAAMAGKTEEVPKRETIVRRGSLFGEPSIDNLTEPQATMYSAARVEENLAISLSHVSPAHDFQRKRTFADLRPSSTVIDISDSPIRSSSSVNPVPSIKKVKQELPEDPAEASDLEHALEAVMAEELGDMPADEVSADEEAAREMHEDE